MPEVPVPRLVPLLPAPKLARYCRALQAFGSSKSEAKPGVFASIPDAMWLGASVLRTVGKFLVRSLVGIGFFALSAEVLSRAVSARTAVARSG